jgi:hypothetical protein
MAHPRVLVVGETPSLATAVEVLLYAEAIPTSSVPAADLLRRLKLVRASSRFPVVVAACNEPSCQTARFWTDEAFPGVNLVVVGGRDPSVRSAGRLHLVRLPLDPSEFIALVRTLLRDAANPPPRVPGARIRPPRDVERTVPLDFTGRRPTPGRPSPEPTMQARRPFVRMVRV